ncbi:Similar to D-amino-acid oxidase; acc. no. Q99042 [Pyronema omphalodes CBS 100304]|uniref:Similar to D-amino-acid oxidase acc. no. Q99042 n=1 Tax=Pyronema omphalodes (strain CBS 100304) TaxID=1076935 RepID=U4KUR1_PYROM|nr:Similar to D-amino-acid oxidase; acc. no. Q99042 [Pyronema omphalodes CBS 100304]
MGAEKKNTKPHIAVVGAGVIGLETSLQLLTLGHPVTIVAAHFPGSTSIDYASPSAGAHWRTQSDDLFIRHCDAITYLSWLSLFSPSPSSTHAEITAALSTPAALAVTAETGIFVTYSLNVNRSALQSSAGRSAPWVKFTPSQASRE